MEYKKREPLNRVSRLLVSVLLFSLLSPLIATQQAMAAGPADIDRGLLLWLDASDVDNDQNTSNPANGTAVRIWRDKSGNGNDAVADLANQETPTMRTSSRINNGPALNFVWRANALGSVYRVPNVDIRAGRRADVTVFTVYRAETATAGRLYGMWGQDNGAWDRFAICCGYQSTAARGVIGLPPGGFGVNGAGEGTRLLTVAYDGETRTASGTTTNYGPTNGSSVWFEGGRIHTFTDSTTASTADGPGDIGAKPDFRIGWDGDDSAFNGLIAEVIIYDRVLTNDEIVSVSSYLGNKYNLKLAPTPVTLDATSIESRTATLNGTVDPNNDTTTVVSFVYSTNSSTLETTTGTSITASPNSISGSSAVSVSALVSGLSPATTYFYRLYAQNSSGFNYGATLSFTTQDPSVVTSCTGAGVIQNGSFENLTGSEQYIDGSFPLGWRTTALATRSNGSKAAIESWNNLGVDRARVSISSPSDASSADGSVIAEIAADNGGDSSTAVRQGLYQDVSTIPNVRVFWSYWHHFRSGGSNNNPQVSVFRAAPAPNNRPQANIWTATEQATPFGTAVSDITTVYDTVTTLTAWQQSQGTFLPSTTSTRFLFQNVQSPDSGYGNLIDDVRFTTFSACPITVSVIAGRTSNFVIQNSEQTSVNPRYFGPLGTTVNSLSSIPNGISISVSNVVNTSSTFSILSNSVGTYNANYRISFPFGGSTYTSTSTLTVNVLPEVTVSRPASVPFDPTLQSKLLPGLVLRNASNAYLCVDQVSNSAGANLTTPTVSISQGSTVPGVEVISTGPPLVDSGTVTGLNLQSRQIRIVSLSGPLGKGGSKYLRFRASSIDNTDGVAPSCANGVSFVVEFRRIQLTQKRSFTVPQSNGRR